MEANNAEAYLVNTGWNGTGKRISIKDTRAIIENPHYFRDIQTNTSIIINSNALNLIKSSNFIAHFCDI